MSLPRVFYIYYYFSLSLLLCFVTLVSEVAKAEATVLGDFRSEFDVRLIQENCKLAFNAANLKKGCNYFFKARGHVLGGEYHNAMGPARSALSAFSKHFQDGTLVVAEAQNFVGKISYIVGHDFAAQSHFELAVRDAPERISFRLNLARQFLDMGRLNRLRQVINCDEIKTSSTALKIQLLCGDFYLITKDYGRASQIYRGIIHYIKNKKSAASGEGIPYRFLLGEWDAKVKLANISAQQHYPERANGILKLAEQNSLNRTQPHLFSYRRADITLKMAETYLLLWHLEKAKAKIKLEHLAKAKVKYEQVLSPPKYWLPRHKNRLKAEVGIGRILRQQKDFDMAILRFKNMRRDLGSGRDGNPSLYALFFHEQILTEIESGNYVLAERHLRRLIRFVEKTFKDNHYLYGKILRTRIKLEIKKGVLVAALNTMRLSLKKLSARPEGIPANALADFITEPQDLRSQFRLHASLALSLFQNGNKPTLVSEAFKAIQFARRSSAGDSIKKMAVRFANSDREIASAIRNHQDALLNYSSIEYKLDAEINKPLTKLNNSRIVHLRNKLNRSQSQLATIVSSIQSKFPKYAELTDRNFLSITDAQKLIKNNEALITFFKSKSNFGEEGRKTHIVMVRRKTIKTYTAQISFEKINRLVYNIRYPMETKQATSFNFRSAHALYQALFKPGEAFLAGVTHLLVVPEGALASLPFGIMVTSQNVPNETGNVQFEQVSWLVKKFAITTLPSISSLSALRSLASKPKSTNPFIGFGDPVLNGAKPPHEARSVASLDMFQGAFADGERMSDLEPLPGTATELKKLSTILDGDKSRIYLREQATEATVKAMKLDNSKVIAFATHGLVSGQLKGIQEPGLVLTLPETATDDDDGYLTASEVAQLKLDAEWVILSACNTAAGNKTGADSLSGLAKAFFYSGARSLLVSHWPVESAAAMALTTGLFNSLKENHILGGAEALRRSMMALMNTPGNAHPMFWAPFTVVGEGN